jgi:hypothetical protein
MDIENAEIEAEATIRAMSDAAFASLQGFAQKGF